MLVPEGWGVTGTPGVKYELTRSGGDGAVHVSVYSRNGTAISEPEARDMMSSFLEMFRPDDAVEIAVLAESHEQHRAVAHCQARDPETDAIFDCLAFLVLWKRNFLMCSCIAEKGSLLLREAEEMFASIYPLS